MASSEGTASTERMPESIRKLPLRSSSRRRWAMARSS